MTELKKFLCLCYYDADEVKTWTPSDQEAVSAACQPHDKALRATGKVLLNSSISEPETARVLRGSAAGPVATEGAYAKTNEPVGAAFIVEAADMDEAVRIASLHPGVNAPKFVNMNGGIEVRALEYFDMPSAKRA
jgi:hypothetical protein